MNTPHTVLVAFSHDGLPSALKVVETLEPIADVQLRSYDRLHEALPKEPDVALCVVTDDESLDSAHEFQVRLDDVPTFVVDSVGGLKIEVNGYAGRISSSPDQVLKTVRQILADNAKSDLRAPRKTEPRRAPRRITSPFDHTLARTAGGGQSPQAIMIAAARQLSWDLRADRVEAFVRTVEKNAFRKVYAEPESSNGKNSAPCAEIVRLIKKRCHPVTLQELEARSTRPLHQYLIDRNLNVLVPLVKEARLLGWLAFALEAGQCTDDLLDDLQVAGHLLAVSVADAYDHEAQGYDAKSVFDALSALKFGIMTIDQEGQITSVSGASTLLGGDPQKGDPFKAIHNSRVREVAALALKGDFVQKSWIDFDSHETINSFVTEAAGRANRGILGTPSDASTGPLEGRAAWISKSSSSHCQSLCSWITRLSPGTVPVPQGRITDEDGPAIRELRLSRLKQEKSRLSGCAGGKSGRRTTRCFSMTRTPMKGARDSLTISNTLSASP